MSIGDTRRRLTVRLMACIEEIPPARRRDLGIEATHVVHDRHDSRSDFHVATLPQLGVLGFDVGHVETKMRAPDIVMMEVERSAPPPASYSRS